MAVKGVVLDLDGTLLRVDGRTVDGVVEMVSALSARGIKVAVASNRDGAAGKLASAGIPFDLLMDHQLVGRNKGSKEWVATATQEFGLQANELVWLGDSELDMREAVNCKVPYFNAGWSTPHYPYGLNMDEPRLFGAVVAECFAKTTNWYYQLTTTDAAGRSVKVRSMTDSRGGGSQQFEEELKRFLKDRHDFPLGPYQFGEVVALHLIGSLYGSGIPARADTWTIYPGSRGGTNQSLAPFVRAAARLFHKSYVDDLLIRHTPSLDSGRTRVQGAEVDFGNQINHVCLTDRHKARIRGKRVVVVDDFETAGHSLECARNLLLQAGAQDVMGISIGKYALRNVGMARLIWTPDAEYRWDPYAPVTHDLARFSSKIEMLQVDAAAPVYFRESCRRIGNF